MSKHQSRRDALTFDGVVRDAATGAPSSFRIWKAGDNTTAHGPTVFTDRSAELLLAQQQTKGTRYSIDVNHLSLDPNAPLQNQRAVGWFSIAVQDGELWAVECEWVDWVKQGLVQDPPEWRYHSPAYDIDVETAEVVSLTNLAITNTPATFYVTALASSEAAINLPQKDNMNEKIKRILAMSKNDMLAAIDAADEETKNAIHSALGAQMVEKARAKASDSEGDEKPKNDDDAATDEAEKKSSDDEAEKKAADNDADKKDSMVASLIAKQDKELADLKRIVASMVKKDETEERNALLSGHEMTKELRASLAALDLASVKKVCAALPKANPLPVKSTEHVQATGLAGSGGSSTGVSNLSGNENTALLDKAFGLSNAAPTVKTEGKTTVFQTMTASQATAHIARKAGK